MHVQATSDHRERRQQRILLLCLAGSLAVHLVGYAWVASMKVSTPKKVPDGFMMVEQWPASRPVLQAPDAGKPGGDAVTARGAPARPVSPVARAPTDVASQVQKKGILRALDAIGRGPIQRGLPGAAARGDLAAGLPDAPRAQVDPAAVPGRRGGEGGAPAVLGDIGTGGGGSGTGSIAIAGALGASSSIGVGASQVGSSALDQGKLDAFVRARIGGLRACYETQLKLDQRRDGTVRMRFSILPTGEIADVAASQNTLGSAVVADCLVGIVRTWRTPFRPSEAVQVEYPFVFRPSRE